MIDWSTNPGGTKSGQEAQTLFAIIRRVPHQQNSVAASFANLVLTSRFTPTLDAQTWVFASYLVYHVRIRRHHAASSQVSVDRLLRKFV